MQNTFQDGIQKENDVMGIFISAKLPVSRQSAKQGREALGSAVEKVSLVDSHSTAMVMGFQVLLLFVLQKKARVLKIALIN